MAKKRFALVGAGLFGEVHARAYSTHAGAEIAAICDLNGERAAEVASKYGAVPGPFHCVKKRSEKLETSVESGDQVTSAP